MKKQIHDEMEIFYRAAWQGLSLGGSAHLSSLLEYFGSAKTAWQMADKDIQQVKGFNTKGGQAVLQAKREKTDYPQRLQEECYNKGISLCVVDDEEYPELLRQIAIPPQVLFYRGHLSGKKKRLAIVGSRKITPYGKAVADSLSRELSAKGVTIVSGGAYGVDTVAHHSALAVGSTEAVLGCGVDVAYPLANRRLYDKIIEKGALISEYPPGTSPLRMFFPIRNRIISGMSRGVVVVEAAQHSGSLITAEYALEENRDIFAVPGSIFSKSSMGCNRLIQQGAKLVASAKDILDEFEDWQQPDNKSLLQQTSLFEKNELLTQEEKAVLKLLTPDNPLDIDDLVYRMKGMNAQKAAYILLQLEIKGKARKHSNGGYTIILEYDSGKE